MVWENLSSCANENPWDAPTKKELAEKLKSHKPNGITKACVRDSTWIQEVNSLVSRSAANWRNALKNKVHYMAIRMHYSLLMFLKK